MSSKQSEKESRPPTPTSEKPEDVADHAGRGGEDTMKVLIDEANKMLQTLQQSEPKGKAIAAKLSGSQMDQLQKQLDEIKRATMKPFRLSKLGQSNAKGLYLTVEQLTLFELVAKERRLIIYLHWM